MNRQIRAMSLWRMRHCIKALRHMRYGGTDIPRGYYAYVDYCNLRMIARAEDGTRAHIDLMELGHLIIAANE